MLYQIDIKYFCLFEFVIYFAGNVFLFVQSYSANRNIFHVYKSDFFSEWNSYIALQFLNIFYLLLHIKRYKITIHL